MHPLESSWAGRGAEQALREHGLRVTRPRLAVLRILAARREHLSVDQINTEVRWSLGTVSIQAVYDILDALIRVGLARRIELAGQPARFEARAGDNHHHVVCRGCGAVGDIDCSVGRAPCLTPSQGHGYVLDEAEVTFWGRCPTCRTR